MLKKLTSLLLCFCTLLGTIAVFADDNVPEGFLTTKGSELYLDGKPFYEISFNDYEVLYKYLNEQAPELYGTASRAKAQQQLKELADSGFTIVRIFAPAYGGSVIKGMFMSGDAQKRKFFKAVDNMLADAKKYGIKFVFCLAQRPMSFDDACDLPMGTLIRDYESASYKLFEEYVTEVVTRYKNSAEIATWEIANEGNLNADLTRMYRITYPYYHMYSSKQLAEFYERITNKIKEIDPYHLVNTGDSTARNAQWHLWNEWETGNYGNNPSGDWTKDTEEQKFEWIEMVHGNADIVSMHWYPWDNPAGFADWVGWAKRLDKPFMIGEFQPDKLSQYVFDLEKLQKYLDEMIDARVSLMLFWNYGTEGVPYMQLGSEEFNMIVKANQRLKELTGSN